MLSETLFRVRRVEGLQTLQRRGEQGARELTTHRLVLSAGKSSKYVSADEETVLVLLEGRGRLEAGGQRWNVQRTNVFADRATALLLPPAAPLTVHAETPLEALLVATPAAPGGEPVLCAPDDVAVVERGTDLYTREVRNLFEDAIRLHAGRAADDPAADLSTLESSDLVWPSPASPEAAALARREAAASAAITTATGEAATAG